MKNDVPDNNKQINAFETSNAPKKQLSPDELKQVLGGRDLGITATDNITISFVHAGKTYTTTFTAKENKLENIFFPKM